MSTISEKKMKNLFINKTLLEHKIHGVLINKLSSKGIPKNYISNLNSKGSLINSLIKKIFYNCVFDTKILEVDLLCDGIDEIITNLHSSIDEIIANLNSSIEKIPNKWSLKFWNFKFDENVHDENVHNKNISRNKSDFSLCSQIDLAVKKICELVYLKEFCNFEHNLISIIKLQNNEFNKNKMTFCQKKDILETDGLFEIVEKICLDKNKLSYPNDYVFEFNEYNILNKFNGENTLAGYYSDNNSILSYDLKIPFSSGISNSIMIGLLTGIGFFIVNKYYKLNYKSI